jgi:hypothetical protein
MPGGQALNPGLSESRVSNFNHYASINPPPLPVHLPGHVGRILSKEPTCQKWGQCPWLCYGLCEAVFTDKAGFLVKVKLLNSLKCHFHSKVNAQWLL